ncbi:hypothetical protein [Reyranella soli]|uniref:Uncharacterized protein n=1 Tax=Reyranella soli TaxID=1230389 RepID=A0A512N2J4_9HYPH|nr:hypothetical protein [Reyranella soli]GEP53204.1 hypothetical protein RSO01_03700 [Reyranella soli]
MRSPLWFVVAGLIALAGFAGALFYVMPRLSAADSAMIRVVVPGNAVLTLDKAGRYTIYHETRSMVDGRYYASGTVSGLRLGLTDEATREPVTLTGPAMQSSYKIGNRSGTSIYAFTIDRPGRYRLAADLAGGRNEPKAVLAIEQGMLGGMFSLIVGAIAIAFAGFGVAGALVLVVLWRRSKAVAPRAS